MLDRDPARDARILELPGETALSGTTEGEDPGAVHVIGPCLEGIEECVDVHLGPPGHGSDEANERRQAPVVDAVAEALGDDRDAHGHCPRRAIARRHVST